MRDFWYNTCMNVRLLAQSQGWSGLVQSNQSTGDGVATIGSLTSVFTNVVQAIVAFSGVVFFVMLLVGGFTFLLSGGDQKQLEKARNTITHAVIGLIVLLVSFLILTFIKLFTGVDVTTFRIEFLNF